MPLKWDSDLDTGIKEIDDQHRQIVAYINDLEQAIASGDRDAVGRDIESVVSYTVNHFAYEEQLMEAAGYRFLKTHRQVHQLFVRNASSLAERHLAGQDVATELHEMLSKWLFGHIRNDDGHYVRAVLDNMTLSDAQPSRCP